MTSLVSQPRIETRDGFTVVGPTARGTSDAIDFMGLWEEFSQREAVLPELAATDEAFGVEYDFDHETNEFTYLAGVAVETPTEVPDAFDRVDVPGGRYAVFETTLESVGETMDAIYGEWLPDAAYERADGPEFECYGPGFDPETNPSFEVWIPVAER